MKNIRILSENFQFLVAKFSIYLNSRVFVMSCFLPFRFLYFLLIASKSDVSMFYSLQKRFATCRSGELKVLIKKYRPGSNI